jgi:Domain of unknown function (DUF6484)
MRVAEEVETGLGESVTAKGDDLQHSRRGSIAGAVIGVLVGLIDEGSTPLVIFPGQTSDTGVPARAGIDIHGQHVGKQIVLVFEDGDPGKPIVVGCLRAADGWPSAPRPVEVESDGGRLIVSAKEQLVLRCGAASITLTRAGKVIIQGAYISSSSKGVNRIKGGSVQLN